MQYKSFAFFVYYCAGTDTSQNPRETCKFSDWRLADFRLPSITQLCIDSAAGNEYNSHVNQSRPKTCGRVLNLYRKKQ